MIRILHVLSSLDAGGVEKLLQNYYARINREQFHFDFIVHGRRKGMLEDYFREQGSRIFHVVPKSLNPVRNFLQMKRIIRSGNYDALHCHQDAMSAVPLYLAARKGVPVRIAHSHVADVPRKKLVKRSLKGVLKMSATHYMACSRSAGTWLFGERIVDGARFRVLNNAIDERPFLFRMDIRQQVRKELGIGAKFVVGSVSRFTFEKNHEFLLEIFGEVLKREPEAVLLLVGDGPLKSKILSRAGQMGIGEHIIFLGVRQDVGRLMQAMDVLVLPSRYEGFGIVLLEAQVSGLPCFVSRHVVPAEGNVTGEVEYISLKQAAGVWAERILRRRDAERHDNSQIIRNGGYEIGSAAAALEEYYLSCLDLK